MSDSPRTYHDRHKTRGRDQANFKKQRELIGTIIEVGEDFLPSNNRRGSYNRQYPTLVVIGREYYSILKLYLKISSSVAVGDEIDIDSIPTLLIKRMSANDWTPELKQRIEKNLILICRAHESKFVEFFNNAKPITTKLHQLRLLPGIGPKRMWQILDIRKMGLFLSYKDIEERTGLSNPLMLIVGRILEELETEQKYQLFTRKNLPIFT